MNEFAKVFTNNKAFVGYITAGHRGLDYTVKAACALVDGGVDILEVGVPFSDPVADGATIQEAMTDALERGYDFTQVLQAITAIKQQRVVPIVLFSYLNPLLAAGLRTSLEQAKAAGVAAVLIVDLPYEFSAQYFAICKEVGLEPVCLVAPTTAPERVQLFDQLTDAFLYYVCRNGTTGVKQALPEDFVAKATQLQQLCTTPVVCGFGIGDSDLAGKVLQHADGFVVGSAFVAAISNGATPEELKHLAQTIDPRN